MPTYANRYLRYCLIGNETDGQGSQYFSRRRVAAPFFGATIGGFLDDVSCGALLKTIGDGCTAHLIMKRFSGMCLAKVGAFRSYGVSVITAVVATMPYQKAPTVSPFTLFAIQSCEEPNS